MHPKLMWAIHAFVHRKLEGDGGAVTWFDSRRTDDGGGRSAAFDEFDLRRLFNNQGSVAGIAQCEDCLYRRIVFHLAIIDVRLVDFKTRTLRIDCAVWLALSKSQKKHDSKQQNACAYKHSP